MIVPSMTAPQAAEDARKDWISLWNKIKPICKAQEHKHRTDRQRLDRIESLKAWRSPRGNNWLIVLSTSKKGTDYAAFVWYRGEDDRLRTIRVDLLRTAADLAPLARALDAADIRWVVVKGPVLSAAYREPNVRSYNDLDVLVHPMDLPAVLDLLEAHGDLTPAWARPQRRMAA